jgi:hypothetical protein
MNIKDIAATLAILGSGALMVGCGKDKPATEVPAGDEAAPPVEGAAEAKCGEGHTEEGHCAGADEAAADGGAEASCSAEGKPEGEGSCSGN